MYTHFLLIKEHQVNCAPTIGLTSCTQKLLTTFTLPGSTENWAIIEQVTLELMPQTQKFSSSTLHNVTDWTATPTQRSGTHSMSFIPPQISTYRNRSLKTMITMRTNNVTFLLPRSSCTANPYARTNKNDCESNLNADYYCKTLTIP